MSRVRPRRFLGAAIRAQVERLFNPEPGEQDGLRVASSPNGGRRHTVAQDQRAALKRRNRARHRAALRRPA